MNVCSHCLCIHYPHTRTKTTDPVMDITPPPPPIVYHTRTKPKQRKRKIRSYFLDESASEDRPDKKGKTTTSDTEDKAIPPKRDYDSQDDDGGDLEDFLVEDNQDMDNTEHFAMNMLFIKPQTPNLTKTVRHVAPNKPSLYKYTRREAKNFEELRVCLGINNRYRQ